MRTVAFGEYLVPPGGIVKVPVEDWCEQAQQHEEAGVLMRLNPQADEVYTVRSCYPAGKVLSPAPPKKKRKTRRSGA